MLPPKGRHCSVSSQRSPKALAFAKHSVRFLEGTKFSEQAQIFEEQTDPFIRQSESFEQGVPDIIF